MQPYFIVYAGHYDPQGAGQDKEMPCYWLNRWTPCGYSAAFAMERLNTYQQEGHDFCGIEIAWAS